MLESLQAFQYTILKIPFERYFTDGNTCYVHIYHLNRKSLVIAFFNNFPIPENGIIVYCTTFVATSPGLYRSTFPIFLNLYTVRIL